MISSIKALKRFFFCIVNRATHWYLVYIAHAKKMIILRKKNVWYEMLRSAVGKTHDLRSDL